MLEPIKQLIALQERDLEIDQLQAALTAIPKEIAKIKKQIDDERIALEGQKKELNQLQLQKKEKEVDLGSKEEAMRKHLGELNSIKSNDAYRAMLGEIEKGKKDQSALEDQILQLMEKIDQAQRVWKEHETTAKGVEGQRQTQISEWETKQKNLEEQIAQKQKERADLGATYPKTLQDRYERLRSGTKGGAVIVPLKGEQCSGCHMRVSPNLVNEVKRGQTLMSCEHCSRLVYLPQAAEQPTKA